MEPPLDLKQHNVKLKDIADICGVTVTTVSRALKYPHIHSEKLTKRIREVAHELGYDPSRNHAARRMALRRVGKETVNHLVALILPENFTSVPYFIHIFDGVMDALTPAGFGLLTFKKAITQSDDIRLPPSFDRGEVDGLILAVGTNFAQPLLKMLRENPEFGNRPVMSLLTKFPDCMYQGVDLQGGAYSAASHLLELGHRHLLHFCAPKRLQEEDSSISSNFAGYRKAYRDHGLDPDAYLHCFDAEEDFWDLMFRSPLVSATTNLTKWPKDHPFIGMFRENPQITGVLALNDPGAIMAYHLLKIGGFRVPRDISIIGVDNSDPLFDEEGENILTTVEVPLEKLGKSAALALITRITQEANDVPLEPIKTRLVLRNSTAPPKPR